MSRLGSSGTWPGLRHRVAPDRLPYRINLLPSRAATLIFLVFGCVWTGITLSYLVAVAPGSAAALLFVALFPLVGLGLVGWSLCTLLSKREAVFGRDGVEVFARSPFGAESWRQDYSAFKGVLHREHRVKRKSGSTTYQIIELLHEDPDRTLPLLVEASRKMPREAWERYAKWLDLPALTDSGDGLVARDSADLDKSVRELAAEGKVALHLEAAEGPPPAGLAVASEQKDGEDRLRVTLTAGRVPLWFTAVFSAFPALFIVVGVLEESPLALFGLLMTAVGIATAVYDRRSPRRILISRRRLVVVDAWQKRAPEKLSFDLDEVESITVQSSRNKGKGLLIASDRTQVHVGGGLSRAALAWLQNYLTAAIATA